MAYIWAHPGFAAMVFPSLFHAIIVSACAESVSESLFSFGNSGGCVLESLTSLLKQGRKPLIKTNQLLLLANGDDTVNGLLRHKAVSFITALTTSMT